DGQTVTLTGSGANIYTWDNGVTNGVAFNPPSGTTTYTVIGTTTAGCTGTDQVDVAENPLPTVSFLPSATIGCSPLTVTFTNTTANSSNCVWSMSDGTVLAGCGSVTNTFEQPGCYDISLTTTSVAGCTNTFTAANLVCVEANPVAAFSPSTNMVSEFNSEVLFTNNSTGASDYQWFFGDNTQSSTEENPTHDYANAAIGEYTVTLIATTPYGCVDTAYSIIQVYEELIFYVPNTFTPDYDNYNQFFTPVFTSGYDPFDYNLYIFNRWGELIFESHNAQIGWDGSYGANKEIEMVQDGTYTWKLEFKVTKNDERKMFVGHVNVLR
ncbi:MAG: PKD domain-containing protein, partial [Flavobacteriales bacterium]